MIQFSPVSATHRLQSPATHRLQSPATHKLASPVSATHMLQSPVSLPDAVSLLLDNADLSHHHLNFQREMICARSVGLFGDEELEELGLTQAEITRFYAHRQQIADNSRDTAFGSCGDAHIGEASHPGPSVPYNTRRQTRPSMINMFMLTVACVISVCDGMGCGLMALQDALKDNSQFDTHRCAYLACEISDDAKKIAANANPVTDRFHMDHS